MNNDKQQTGEEGYTVKRIERDGRIVDVTYDTAGNVIGEVVWLKGKAPAEPAAADPRISRPSSGREQRPL